MNYETLVDGIVAQLAGIVSGGVDIVRLPEIESQRVRPTTKPQVTVMYMSSEFLDHRSTNEVVQDELITVALSIESRRLYGTSGVHNVARAVIAKLVGYRPVDCDKMKAKEFTFNAEPYGENIWKMDLQFNTKSLLSEAFALPVDPTLTTITLNNPTINS